MRRIIAFILALLVWTTTSGIAGAVHHAITDHDSAAHHDEANCRICVSLNAPVLDGSQQTIVVGEQPDPSEANPFNSSLLPALLDLTPSCRGPPVC